MKCPCCKREIAYAAMACKCGWSARVSERKVLERCVPVSPEIREKLDLLTRKFRLKAQVKVEREPRKEYMHEVTPRHGNVCCCEVCWVKRMRRAHAKPQPGDEAEGSTKETGNGKL